MVYIYTTPGYVRSPVGWADRDLSDVCGMRTDKPSSTHWWLWAKTRARRAHRPPL